MPDPTRCACHKSLPIRNQMFVANYQTARRIGFDAAVRAEKPDVVFANCPDCGRLYMPGESDAKKEAQKAHADHE